MRILVADTFPAEHLEELESLGHDVVSEPGLNAASLPDTIAGHDALVVRSTAVRREAIEAADRLSLVVRAGAGIDTIDIQAAAEHGVVVANTPGKNAIAVAELTMALITAIDRNVPDNVADLRSEEWNKKRWTQAQGLAGRKLGIVGFGAIGVEVARRARAFAMSIVVVDRPGRAPEAAAAVAELGCILVPDVETLFGESDIVTFHVPVTAENAGMVDRELLRHLRRGSVLINTSRGDIIDEAALLEAIDAKDLRVGLDVYSNEPRSGSGEFTSELAKHPRVYGTHHIGASTRQAQRAIADAVVDIIDSFARGAVRNAVNLAAEPMGTSVITVRHENRVGVLAQVFQTLRAANLNVEHMENTIFAGGVAASASIHLSGTPDAPTVQLIEGMEHVIGVSMGPLMGRRSLARPFSGYLPRPDLAPEVSAPPLSSITADRYDHLVADNPNSILHVLRTAIDTAEGGQEPSLADLAGAARLRRMIADGVLVPQPEPAFYVYRIESEGLSHVGVLTEVALSGLDDGRIRRHEDTRRETEDLILAHLEAVRAHTDPVAMTYRSNAALAAQLEGAMRAEEPTLDFRSGDGARQQVWVVGDPASVEAISAQLATIDTLYITDGHHRFAAAARMAELAAARDPGHTGTEACNYLPAVLFAEDQLELDGYHRAVTGLGDLSAEEVLLRLKAVLEVEELAVPWAEEARPQESGVMGMLLDGRWYRVAFPIEGANDGDPYDRLDAVLLQEHVLGPILGITKPRADPRLQYIPGPAGLGEFGDRDDAVGFALHPPSCKDVMALADTGRVMPPKSTWFRPKVRAGLVVRFF